MGLHSFLTMLIEKKRESRGSYLFGEPRNIWRMRCV